MKTEKPILDEVFADNGEHSHWVLIDPTNGEKLWSEDPTECKAMGFPVSPSHSEETETTPTPWTYRVLNIQTSVIEILENGERQFVGRIPERDAKTVCRRFNSYSTLKAENERLEKEVLKLESENEKQLSELLKTGETLDACENVLADAQIDNEAKQKRIQRLHNALREILNISNAQIDDYMAGSKLTDCGNIAESALTQ